MRRSVIAVSFLAIALTVAEAQKKSPTEEMIAPVRVDKGLKVEVWASEPLLQNPVAFCFDEKGTAYVAETNRLHTGTPDTRNFMKWLDEDLACRTIADRLAMYQKHGYGGFEKHDDIVRKVWDSTGRGAADKSSVFSKGYNQPADGLGAGVLARKGKVYFTNIPDLYELQDTTGDHTADKKTSLFTGFGLSVQFVGHDLHGLRMGPDGRLYFTIGDRGFNVKTKEGKQLSYPNQGAVLRCELDGSNLEVVHHGLRNPQEIAFDDFGNLFTYDNNCDAGDRARWVQIVEGGDSGWRGGYQYDTLYAPPGSPKNNRGPWHGDKLWHVPTKDSGPPAWVVPPLAHFGNGPSGITHYPGIGLGEKYKDHFFACDFTANAGNSTIWAVSVKPKGASFEVKNEPFVRGIVPTDCEFGPDGAFYWTDWIGGWGHPNRGRIFRLTDPEAMKNPAVAEAKKILGEGIKHDERELTRLLFHPHKQVRLEAQYKMAEDTLDGTFARILLQLRNSKERTDQIAKLHSVWGLGHYDRLHPEKGTGWLVLLTEGVNDPDPMIRSATLLTLASAGPIPEKISVGLEKEYKFTRANLARLLTDPDARVQSAAAVLYGKIGRSLAPAKQGDQQDFFEPLFGLLKSNNDQDAYLRHAAVVGLTAAAKNPVDLFNAWSLSRDKYDVPAVRLGVVLALRRHRSEKIAEFLSDADPKIVAETAMAIHDERIAGAYAKLAAIADRSGLPHAASYRAIAANSTLGAKENAERVAKIAANSGMPDYLRVFALRLLATWGNPPRRDPITGLIHDLPKREAAIAADALKPVVAGIFIGPDAVRNEAIQTSAKLGMKEVGPLLLGIVKDTKAPATGRADALLALAAIKDSGLEYATSFALVSDQPRLRAAGLTLRAKADPAGSLKTLTALLDDEKSSQVEKQAAFAILGGFPESEPADKLLAGWLKQAATREAPRELLLDIVEAAEARTKTAKLKLHAPLKAGLEDFQTSKPVTKDPLAPWTESFAGGDEERGRNLFLTNSAVYCARCHKYQGQGGDVGPPLDGIASQKDKDRRYLLEAIVLPSAKIASGFETAVLTLVDGRVVSGVVKEDTKKQVKLLTAEAKELVIPTEDIESRRTGPSAMPDDLHKKLTRRELRDLVEFLVSLKEPKK